MTTLPKPSLPRTAIRGALEGALFVGAGIFIGAIISKRDVTTAWQQALIGAGYGAFIFAAGRAQTGKLLGAVLGGLAGIAVGFVLGDQLIGEYVYETPDTIQAGQELEIAGPTLQGSEFDLRSLRGKVVLVDFWATWCGPCVAELPNVRNVYDQYHKNGFEVVGVSLDHSRANLALFVEQKQIPWPQIFFPDEGAQSWSNPLARKYGVDGIPRMMLVDQQGHVAFDGLRGAALGRAVAHLLKKGDSSPDGPRPPAVTMTQKAFPLGHLIGSLVGCLIGSFAGAFVERAGKRTLNRPAAPARPANESPDAATTQ